METLKRASPCIPSTWHPLCCLWSRAAYVRPSLKPSSPARQPKLVDRTVFESVDDETVVFVLGDHGMTEDGNHGGATPEETGAALLVWSRSGERLLGPNLVRNGAREKTGKKRKIMKKTGDDDDGLPSNTLGGRGERGTADRKEWGLQEEAGAGAGEPASKDHPGGDSRARSGVTGRKVAQIDLVPTISLLLGTPIPFGSLGGVIPEVFVGQYIDGGEAEERAVDDDDPRYLERLCDALLVNSVQVRRNTIYIWRNCGANACVVCVCVSVCTRVRACVRASVFVRSHSRME